MGTSLLPPVTETKGAALCATPCICMYAGAAGAYAVAAAGAYVNGVGLAAAAGAYAKDADAVL